MSKIFSLVLIILLSPFSVWAQGYDGLIAPQDGYQESATGVEEDPVQVGEGADLYSYVGEGDGGGNAAATQQQERNRRIIEEARQKRRAESQQRNAVQEKEAQERIQRSLQELDQEPQVEESQ